MELPRKEFLGLGEIVNADCGIRERDVLEAVKSGSLRRVVFPGRTYGKYRRSDVLKVFGFAAAVPKKGSVG